MVFSGGQNVERGGTNRKEDGIFSDNFGGLNLTASDLNCPYEDSPKLYNTDVDISGKITKRKGTVLIKEDSDSGTLGYTLFPFVSGLRYTFLVEKQGTDLRVYETNDDTFTLLMTKSNVWDSSGADVRANYVRTSEVEPRIIMTTGVNQPVQLRFVEQQEVAASGETDFTLANAERFENATTSNIVVYKNRTRITPTAVSYAAGVLTLDDLDTNSGDVVDVILVTWQHIVEAAYFTGDRFAQRVTRFNATDTDQNVEIPERLRDDPIQNYSSTDPYLYGLMVYNSDQWDIDGSGSTQYDYQNDFTPASATEFCYGNGTLYDNTVGGTVTPAPLFITFGAITGSDPIEVFIARRRDLYKYFNGGVALTGDDLKVYVDGVLSDQHDSTASASATFADYYLIDEDDNVETASNTECRYITFEASDEMGVPEDADVEIIHVSTDFIGSNATTDVELYKDGACEPQYGLGIFADYYSGAFPSNVSLFENRLVYSDFPNNNLLIIFSEIGDKTIPVRPYRLFQVETLNSNDDDPFDVRLNSRADDFVTGLVVWQKSLIIFTRQGVWRISGNNGSFNASNYSLNLISTLGLVNSYSVTVAEKSVLFLSDVGVFDLSLGIDSDDYVASEKSLKIRKVFTDIIDVRTVAREGLAWMSYDSNTQKVYLGLPINEFDYTSSKLYVYNVFRESWTEYFTPSGFYTYYGTQYQDFTNGTQYILSVVTRHNGSNVPSNRLLIRTEGEYYVDFFDTATGDEATTDFNVAFDYHYVNHSTTENIHTYEVSAVDNDDVRGFDLIDIQDVQDVEVQLEDTSGGGTYTTLTMGTDYVKKPNNVIYLLDDPGDSRDLRIYARSPVTDSDKTRALYGISSALSTHHPVWVTVDHQLQVPGTDYDMDREDASNYNVEFGTAPATNTVIRYGQMYPVYYESPSLTLDSFAFLKRVKHLYAYFDNELGMDEYTSDDLNTEIEVSQVETPQPATELVGEKKQRLNANLAIRYESDFDADVVYDLYGFSSLLFDDTLFDIYPSANQFRRYSLFKEYLLGTGYSYKLILWSYDETTFTLSAYQVTSDYKAHRYINWTQ